MEFEIFLGFIVLSILFMTSLGVQLEFKKFEIVDLEID